jgi:hypothetical protein
MGGPAAVGAFTWFAIGGGEIAPSRLHLGSIALEVIKALTLLTAGALTLA